MYFPQNVPLFWLIFFVGFNFRIRNAEDKDLCTELHRGLSHVIVSLSLNLIFPCILYPEISESLLVERFRAGRPPVMPSV